MKLDDKEVQDAIAHFIEEARLCAQTQRKDGVLGFAAMSTIFSCILAVGEALTGGKGGPGAAYQAFYDEIDDHSWLLPPKGTTYSDAEAIEKLRFVRNGLAHALTMPPDVMLLPNRASDKDHEVTYGEEHLSRCRLVVPDFIDAVEETINKIGKDSPGVAWDPKGTSMGWDRGPVATLSVPRSSEEETGLSTGSSTGSPVYWSVATAGSTPAQSRGEEEAN
jgi:hypothetical protein